METQKGKKEKQWRQNPRHLKKKVCSQNKMNRRYKPDRSRTKATEPGTPNREKGQRGPRQRGYK